MDDMHDIQIHIFKDYFIASNYGDYYDFDCRRRLHAADISSFDFKEVHIAIICAIE